MHCTGGSCRQGRAKCATPEACNSEVMGGTYWPLLANPKPHIAPPDDEPLSDTATACFIAFIVTVMLALLAAAVYGMVFP